MRVVWKYPVGIGYVTELRLPRGARVVHVAAQEDKRTVVQLWVEHDPDALRVEGRLFEVLATGEGIPEDCTYVGTAVDHVRSLVWHVYEGSLVRPLAQEARTR